MLEKPNVIELMPKVGSRYDVVLAVSKRARNIADRRIKNGDDDISDPVDVAANELSEDKVQVVSEETIQDATNEIEEAAKEVLRDAE